jgi:hypothetical protein
MLGAILNWLSGGVLDRVLGYFSARQDARLEAMNDAQRQAHERALSTEQTAKEVRVATSGFWEMRALTVAIALPFVAHLWSVWLDTQFGFGWAIDKFPAPFDEWQGAILLSFFGLVGFATGARAIAGAIAMRGR